MDAEHLSRLRGRDVSRETFDRLAGFVGVLEKWNARINLVSSASLKEVWTRHILDSLQLFDHADARCGHWADLGCGGGFPGLVVALAARTEAPDLRVSLVESDKRKAAFLAAVLRETGATASVHPARIETLPPLAADVVSARALAPLDTLIAYAARHMSPKGKAFFPKGRNCKAELTEALASWRFRYQKHPSKTDSQAVILQIEDIARG